MRFCFVEINEGNECIIKVRKNKGQNKLFFKGDEKGFSVEMKGTKGIVTYLKMCLTFRYGVGVMYACLGA